MLTHASSSSGCCSFILVASLTIAFLAGSGAGFPLPTAGPHDGPPGGALFAATDNGQQPTDLMSLTHDGNAVSLSISNTGQIGNDLFTGNAAGVWPTGTGNTYLFGCGMWIGGLADVDGDGTKDTVTVYGYDPLSGRSEHREGRVGQDPTDPLARVFSSNLAQDLIDWPDEFRDDEGDPVVYSLQDFVTIYHDSDGEPLFEAGPAGIEVRQRSMAFVGGLNFNAILIFYEIVNRSDSLPDGPFTIEEAYVGFVSDTDIGDEFADDQTSLLDSVETYRGRAEPLRTGFSWDSDFTENGWEGKVGFVGITLLQPPGDPWDGTDNDGDGLIDESPFDGVDDDGDGTPDDIPDEVDTVSGFNYSYFISPSTGEVRPDPQTDSGAYRMLRCLTEDDCVISDIASDIRFMVSSGPFDLPPGESQIAGFALVFADPVGEPDYLELYGDPPRPDPGDTVLTDFVATILSVGTLYENGFEDEPAPFLIFGTTELEDTNDPEGPYPVSTIIIDSIPLMRNTLHYKTDDGSFEEVLLEEGGGNVYSGQIPGLPVWSRVGYYIQAVDSAFQVQRDPWNAPLELFEFSIVDAPEFSGLDCEPCLQALAAASADFDGDDLPDLFLVRQDGSLLLRNTGVTGFEDVTEASGIEDIGYARGASWGDYDNDGYPDLFLAHYLPGDSHALFRNRGDGTFEEVTDATGVSDSIPTSTGLWGDVDGDGLLDLLTVQLGTDRLYLNGGDGTFSEVSAAWGIEEEWSDRTGALFDMDADGDQDLILAGGGMVFLYANEDGGGFLDVTASSGISPMTWASLSIGDYNNDERPDVLMSGTPLALFEGTGTPGRFTEVTDDIGLGGLLADDASFADMNVDGLLDIVTSAPAVLIRRPDSTFEDLTDLAGVAPGTGYRDFALPADIDRDGFSDFLVDRLWQGAGSPAMETRHWLGVRLEGTVSPRGGVGSRVRAYTGDLSAARWAGGGGAKSQPDGTLLFGLDTHAAVDSLVVDWPSEARQLVEMIPADQYIVIEEDSSLGIEGGEIPGGLPRSYALAQNYPNPFNPQTAIRFDIPERDGSEAVRTKLAVFDMRGRLVRVLVDDLFEAGRHTVLWDGSSANGTGVPSGIYFYRLEAGDFTTTRKMILLR